MQSCKKVNAICKSHCSVQSKFHIIFSSKSYDSFANSVLLAGLKIEGHWFLTDLNEFEISIKNFSNLADSTRSGRYKLPVYSFGNMKGKDKHQ